MVIGVTRTNRTVPYRTQTAPFPTPWLKITSGEISVNQQEHVGNLAVIELLRRVLGRAAAPAEALDPRRLNRGMS